MAQNETVGTSKPHLVTPCDLKRMVQATVGTRILVRTAVYPLSTVTS